MDGPANMVVAFIILCDLALAGLIITTAVRACWTPIVEAFPPRDIAPGAVRRNFQSFGAGLLNLTWCIHTAADARFLHLRPCLFARLLGLRDTSIPWEHVHLDAHDRRRRRRRVSIAGHSLDGPRWALELADPRG